MFGSKQQIFVVVIKKNNEIVGIAPMMICKTKVRGFPVSSLKFMSNDDSPMCDFIIKNSDISVCEEVIKAILKNRKRWDVLLFENIREDSESVQCFKRIFEQENIKYCFVPKLNSPWITLNKDWDSFFGKLSAKSRKTIRNVVNRVHRLGNVEVHEFKSADKMEIMADISRKAWKYKEGNSYLNKQDRQTFFKKLSDVTQKRGWLALWVLQIDDKPVAYEYHLNYGKSCMALIAEFDQEYYKYSPGAVLDFQIIKHLFEKKEIKNYCLGGSLDEYKRKWKPRISTQNDYYAFNGSPYSLFIYYVESKLVRMLKRLRKN